ncbi:glycosyltransferase family 4 protein [uncultured Fusobacterium sp.]|uniref:glycosyltransferase family 4 protein n=1 Tax=uncultured Fusobacterium sp. TaxID=159267 RepID=UPI0015A51EEC|nr:glycosyltransferase family 4 protein [uncultured Fusobacterium sp.]
MKVLIWKKEKDLSNCGGDTGYLWNLNFFLKKENIKEIEFIDKNFVKRDLIKRLEKRKDEIKNFFVSSKVEKQKNELIYSLKRDMKIKKEYLNKFDFIHFHSSKELYKNLENLKNIKPKIILQSHSPELQSMENLEKEVGLKNLENDIEFIEKYKEYDYKSFERADYLIFPCEEAMEPYLKDNQMKKILEAKKERINFISTGLVEKYENRDDEYFYKKYNIPKDAIIISYIGRHNKIKGYDLLVKASEKILEKYKNVYFVIAGNEDKEIKKPNSKYWIECGWTNEGLKIMKNSDLFILPNRETYFDLIFLELLSQNATILCSYTGGNKYFEKYSSQKIKFFERENIDDLIKKFDEFYPILKILKEKEDNLKIFKENFTIDKFGKNYLELLKKLYSFKRSI